MKNWKKNDKKKQTICNGTKFTLEISLTRYPRNRRALFFISLGPIQGASNSENCIQSETINHALFRGNTIHHKNQPVVQSGNLCHEKVRMHKRFPVRWESLQFTSPLIKIFTWKIPGAEFHSRVSVRRVTEM